MTDFSDCPCLQLYKLLTELKKETKKPVTIWLHKIAIAATIDPEVTSKNLRLRPDDTWRIFLGWERKKHYRKTGTVNRWGDNPPSREYAGSHPETIDGEWKIESSYLTQFKNVPDNPEEPLGLKLNLDFEGIKIYRDDFRTWCLASGYNLPRFWFPEETKILGLEEKECRASEVLRANKKNYSTTKEKNAAIKAVLGAVKAKISTGRKWHHLTELRNYMEKEGIQTEKEGGLNIAVKAAMRKQGIQPTPGPAPKK